MATAVGPRVLLGAIAAGAVAVLALWCTTSWAPGRTAAGVPRRRIHDESFEF